MGKEMSDREAALEANRMRGFRERLAKEEAQRESTQSQVTMTTAMRDLHLKHESDIQEKRDSIESLKDDIKKLETEIEYTRLAYEFLNHYTKTGHLAMKVFDSAHEHKMYRQERHEGVVTVDSTSIDNELFLRCFSKYGFELESSSEASDTSTKHEFRLAAFKPIK